MRAMKNASAAALVGIWMILLTAFVVTILYVGRQLIEAEVGDHRQAEIEARSRLGNRLISTGNAIHAAVALVYPDHLRSRSGEPLRAELRSAEFEYVLFTIEANGETARFPIEGSF